MGRPNSSESNLKENRSPLDLGEATAHDWAKKLWYKWKHRPPPAKKMVEDADGNMIEIEEPEPEILPGELPPAIPWQKLEPTASTHVLDNESKSVPTQTDVF